MGQPLEGLRVLELAEGIAGPYAGKLLADLGADVIKLEPPSGDRSRTFGPMPRAGGMSSTFVHLNANKRSAVADLDTPDGAALALALAARSDLVLTSLDAGRAAATGLTPEALGATRSGLAVVSVTPFGLTGPRATWKGEEILTYACAGVMSSTGLARREPVKMGGDLGQYHHGTIAAIASLAAVTQAEGDGRSVLVDAAAVDAQFTSIDRRLTFFLFHVFTGLDAPRSAGAAISPYPTGVFPTADGYVMISTAPRWIPRMLGVLSDEALSARYAAGNPLADPELPQLVFESVLGWTIVRTSQDAMMEAQAAGWPVTALNTPDRVLDDPHLAARGFWSELALPEGGTAKAPGAPVRFHGEGGGWRLRRPAPALDADRAEVLAAAAAPAEPRSPGGQSAPRRLPLEGVVVVEITVAWAGPYASMLLADLGATVVRVDNPNVFPTNTRGLYARPPAEVVPLTGPIFAGYPDLDPGERPWNRAAGYLGHARGKQQVTIDPRTEAGREALLALLGRADVFIENNSVELLTKLGIDWETARARNPRLVMVRMPSTGLDGPYRHFLGFGTNMEAVFGLTSLRGYPDVDYGENDHVFHMDAASGGVAAFAAIAALRRRERTGVGELVEVAQSENMLNHIGEVLLDVQRGATDELRIGNRHRWRAPQGVYRCLDAPDGTGGVGRVGGPTGPDRWVAVSVGDDGEWAALRTALGDPTWAADGRFAGAAGRRTHHDEIDAGIAAWTSTRTHVDAATHLQAHGVPAAPVLTESEQRVDSHLRARGLIRPNHGDEIGTHDWPGHPFAWDGPPLAFGELRPMGVDTEEVLRHLVGIDDELWATLVAEGHVSRDFRGPDGQPL